MEVTKTKWILTHRHVQIGTILLVAVAWIVQRILLGSTPVFPVDDGYITLHNAQVLYGAKEVNYAGSAALTGATSVIHTALVALLLTALSPLQAMDASLWLGILLYALGLVRLGQVNKASPLQALLLVVVGLTVAQTPHQMLNGLETGLTLAAMTWSLALASEQTPRRNLMVAAGILPFLRPELLALTGLIFAFQCFRRWQEAKGDRRAFVRSAGQDIVILAIAALPWLGLYAVNTGVWYPTTMGAKKVFFAEALLPAEVRTLWLTNGLTNFFTALGLITVALIQLPLTKLGRVCAFFLVVFVAAYWANFPGALSHYTGRYCWLLLPLLLLGVAQAAGSERKPVRLVAAVVLFLTAAQTLLLFPDRWQQHLNDRHQTTVELASVAAFCQANVPADATILMHDAGYLSFATNRHFVDFVGLKTPWCIPYHEQITFPSVGVERAEAVCQIALRSQSKYLVMLTGWDEIFRITPGLAARGWRLTPLRTFSENYPIPISSRYQVYRLTR